MCTSAYAYALNGHDMSMHMAMPMAMAYAPYAYGYGYAYGYAYAYDYAMAMHFYNYGLRLYTIDKTHLGIDYGMYLASVVSKSTQLAGPSVTQFGFNTLIFKSVQKAMI